MRCDIDPRHGRGERSPCVGGIQIELVGSRRADVSAISMREPWCPSGWEVVLVLRRRCSPACWCKVAPLSRPHVAHTVGTARSERRDVDHAGAVVEHQRVVLSHAADRLAERQLPLCPVAQALDLGARAQWSPVPAAGDERPPGSADRPRMGASSAALPWVRSVIGRPGRCRRTGPFGVVVLEQVLNARPRRGRCPCAQAGTVSCRRRSRGSRL